MTDYTTKHYVKLGEKVQITVAHSEVCMYMGVAGKVMTVELMDRKTAFAQYPVAQLYDNGRMYSAPITTGEAGFYWDSEVKAYYCYLES